MSEINVSFSVSIQVTSILSSRSETEAYRRVRRTARVSATPHPSIRALLRSALLRMLDLVSLNSYLFLFNLAYPLGLGPSNGEKWLKPKVSDELHE